jgi:hypothetical protein
MAVGSSGGAGWLNAASGTSWANRLAVYVPWLVWGAMFGAVVACIAVYGVDLPYSDDWHVVPALTGNEPHFFSWLWTQWSEHRVPVPRLIHVAVLKATGGSFLAVMLLNTVIVAGVTAAMMSTARQIRGRAAVTDVVFPLVMLHLGNSAHMLWAWGIQFVSTVALAVVMLVVIARQAGPLRPGPAALAAAALLLLPLTGAQGLIMAGALAPWVLACAWFGSRARRADESWWPPAILAIAVLGSVAEALLYFVGLVHESWASEPPGVAVAVKTAAKVLAYGFGPMAARWWPISVPGIAAVLFSSGALALVAVAREGGGARLRALGLCAFGAGLAALALAIGWGRGAFGIHHRYVLLAALGLCWAYFVWELYAKPAPRWITQWALVLVLVAVLPSTTYWYGIWVGDWHQTQARAVLRDIDAGMTPRQLADRHGDYFGASHKPHLAERIDMLRRARIEPWARVAAPPGG